MESPEISIAVKFNGKLISVDCVLLSSSVSCLKLRLYDLTNVAPENQRLLGLVAKSGYTLSDDLLLENVLIKPSTKLMLIGSTDDAIRKVNEVPIIVPDVLDDFDFTEEDVEVRNRPENLEKVARRCATYKILKIAEPRLGKRLLVLDIDYTIFDHQTPAESAALLMRPHLHAMLSRAYQYYDIAIWSATSMTWILAKLGQMGLLPPGTNRLVYQQRMSAVQGSAASLVHPDNEGSGESGQPGDTNSPFRISHLLDSDAMISVHIGDRGVKEVKPLAVVWNQYPQWGPHNTIMFDDVRRNFAMNPQSGLRIHSYRDAHVNNATDTELLRLSDYLELIAIRETDFKRLNHDRWERYLEKHRHRLQLSRNEVKVSMDTAPAVGLSSEFQPPAANGEAVTIPPVASRVDTAIQNPDEDPPVESARDSPSSPIHPPDYLQRE